MGEYAEMMLDGSCCECCGEYMGEATGIPGYCSRQCAADRGAEYHVVPPPKFTGKTKCPECGKKVKATGLRDHMRDMHHA